MAKELYLYTNISDWSAERFIASLEENKNEDISLRMNTDGGDPQAAWGMIAKMKEHRKDVEIKVDGAAFSSGAFMLPYATRAEGLEVSRYLIHRAAYWNEGNLTDAQKSELAAMNADLRKALEQKIDVKKFESIAKVTLDDVFDLNRRIDVFLNAEQAKEIGLIQKITPINKAAASSLLSTNYQRAMAQYTEPTKPIIENQNYNTMTLQELKASNPKLYAEIFNEGVTAERDRVEACLVFMDVDAKGVKAAIESGKPLSAKAMAEFALKQSSPEALKKLQAESTESPKTEEVKKEANAEDKEVNEFSAELDKKLGLKK